MEKRIDLQSEGLVAIGNTTPVGASLTATQRECAELYILSGIDLSQVCDLLNCEEKDLPQEFYDYADQVAKDYNDWCDRMRELELIEK